MTIKINISQVVGLKLYHPNIYKVDRWFEGLIRERTVALLCLNIYICGVIGSYPGLPGRIKRESGENPELSRSCKLHNRGIITMSLSGLAGWEDHTKGSKSEDLP
jgi:hypothetical protein